MVSTQQQTPQMVCESAKKIISPATLIAELLGICESRVHAVSSYPHAKNAGEKFDSIAVIRTELALAKAVPNWKESVRICLRLEHRFLFLAPTSTFKLHKDYITKIEGYMAACREVLGLTKQF